jgi:hypothetical protein
MSKLQELAESEGMTIEEMLEQATFDCVAPSICMNKNCSTTYSYEPDCTEGWCEECETNSVKSCLVLAGII